MQHTNVTTTTTGSPVKPSKAPRQAIAVQSSTKRPAKAPRITVPSPSGKGGKSLGTLRASLTDQTGVTKKNTRNIKTPTLKKIHETSTKVKPFNYLNYIKINKVWKLDLKQLLSEAMVEYGNDLLETYDKEENEDGEVSVAQTDDFTTNDLVNYFASPIVNGKANPVGCAFLDRSPQIQNSAKQLLYNTMDHIGKEVLMGYNEQRCSNLRETIQAKDCCAQWFGKHSFKQGCQLMTDSKNIFS
jgi:hypothetical protein